jgi:hypothetical protein
MSAIVNSFHLSPLSKRSPVHGQPAVGNLFPRWVSPVRIRRLNFLVDPAVEESFSDGEAGLPAKRIQQILIRPGNACWWHTMTAMPITTAPTGVQFLMASSIIVRNSAFSVGM